MMTTAQSAAGIGLPKLPSTFSLAVLKFKAATLQLGAALVATDTDHSDEAEARSMAAWSDAIDAMRDLLKRPPVSAAEAGILAGAVAFYFDHSGQRVDVEYEFADVELELMFATIRASGKFAGTGGR